MDLTIKFISGDSVDAKIASELEISKDELLVLKFLLKEYIIGVSEHRSINVLMEIFKVDDYEYLKNIDLIENLLDNGWIVGDELESMIKDSDNKLELLNSTISLSSSFLRYMQNGKQNNPLNEDITPYSDHLEYLQDQFVRIDYYKKLSQSRLGKGEHNTQKIEQKLTAFETIIASRIDATQKNILVEDIFSENALSQKEQIIFLALLKDEYAGEYESLREINTLISLVSSDNYERIKNRVLLDDDSKLITSGLVDYEELLGGFGGVSRNFYINDETLQSIMRPNKKAKTKKIKLDSLVEKQDIFELVKPTTSLDDVVMHPRTREVMNDLLKQVDSQVIARLKKWGIKKNRRIDAKIMLYGPPGTGKTMTATSLAKSLKKEILSFDCSKILSKYVGESEQNVRRIFDTYKEICQTSKSEPILLLNEADQFLSSRTEGAGGGADKMHNQMQNIFLEQIEKFEGILVATTNFLQSLDNAFSRRFDYKIEFKKPDFNQRLDLWRRVLPEEAVYEENFDIKDLASFALSGGQIVLVLKNTALKVAVKDEPIFTIDDFKEVIQREISGDFSGEKFVGFVKN